MDEFILHDSQMRPDSVELPFKWRAAQSGPKAGELSFANGCLAVFDQERWVHFDFAKTLSGLRPAPGGIVNDPLARALGLVKKKYSRVVDASCGSGKDALQVWSYGVTVLAYERHPLVYMLLWDALRRHPLPNFELRFGDAAAAKLRSTDVIMFDPMFEQAEKKKTLARKEMQLFKTLVGGDEDQDAVLKCLLASGAGQVVIKRPLRIKSELPANHSLTGKTIRYDVYLSQKVN